jgi:hypothetical protein
VNERINLACSGARTQHIWRGSEGGQVFKGEPPQGDQLATVAQQKNVKLVVLTITANDLGFSDHVIDCTVAWSTSSSDNPDYCWPEEQAEMQAAMPAARAGFTKAIDEIRAVMSGAGYASSQYRLLAMGYASPVRAGRITATRSRAGRGSPRAAARSGMRTRTGRWTGRPPSLSTT